MMRTRFRAGLTFSLLAAGLFGVQSSARAQDAAITGQVTNASTAEPVDGATVLVRGTSLGAITDPDGRFRIDGIEPGPVTVIASMLGYRSAEVAVTVELEEVRVLNIRLEQTAIALEAVVASVEAAAVQRKEIGTDITRIEVQDIIETAAITSFTDLLNARAENVQISEASGQIGTGSRITIRGATSLTQDNVPLIIVDGVRYSNQTQLDPTNRGADSGGEIDTGGQTTSRFEDLNPNDIATIEVIKGPTAATLYGSEAASGVLVITTRKGTRGQEPRISVRTRQGFQVDRSDYPTNYADVTTGFGVTDPDDPRLAGFRTAQNPVTGTVYVLDNLLEDEDSSPFRRGWQSTYGASVVGGGEDSRYYGSVEYEQLDGTVVANGLERFRGRANFSFNAFDLIDVSVSTGYVGHQIDLVDTSTLQGWVAAGVLGSPVNAYGDSPTPGQGPCLMDVLTGEDTGVCDGRNGGILTTFENLARIEQGEELDRFTGSLNISMRPTTWLTLNGTGGIDQFGRRIHQLIPFDPNGVFGGASRGDFVSVQQQTSTITADVGATAAFEISPRLSTVTSAGAQAFVRRTARTGCSGDTFSSSEITSCDGALISRGIFDELENAEVGVFGQQRLGWDDWVFLTGGLRIDDNSALGDNVAAIVSPSASASVVLSDAPFWNTDFFNVLRLRLAWGVASQSPDQFAAARTYVNAPVTADGQPVQGLTAQNPGNPELGPERSEEFEVGFDGDLLGGRVGLSFTYFRSETTDAIVPVPVPPSSGFPGDQFVNLGSIKNHGIEARLNGRLVNEDKMQWDAALTASTQNPTVTDLGRADAIFFPTADVGTTASGFSQVFAPGLPPGAYVSWVVASATRDENGTIVDYTLAPGDPGLDGKQVVGSPVIGNQQTLSSTITLFNSIRISTLFDRKGDTDLLNTTEKFGAPFITPSAASPTSAFNERYAFRHLESPETQAEIEQRFIRPFMYDGSYIRWRELTIGYTVPEDVVERFGFEEAQLTVGGRNLATWTKFPGIDVAGNIQGAQDNFIRSVAFEFGVPSTFFTELSVTF